MAEIAESIHFFKSELSLIPEGYCILKEKTLESVTIGVKFLFIGICPILSPVCFVCSSWSSSVSYMYILSYQGL